MEGKRLADERKENAHLLTAKIRFIIHIVINLKEISIIQVQKFHTLYGYIVLIS